MGQLAGQRDVVWYLEVRVKEEAGSKSEEKEG